MPWEYLLISYTVPGAGHGTGPKTRSKRCPGSPPWAGTGVPKSGKALGDRIIKWGC